MSPVLHVNLSAHCTVHYAKSAQKEKCPFLSCTALLVGFNFNRGFRYFEIVLPGCLQGWKKLIDRAFSAAHSCIADKEQCKGSSLEIKLEAGWKLSSQLQTAQSYKTLYLAPVERVHGKMSPAILTRI